MLSLAVAKANALGLDRRSNTYPGHGSAAGPHQHRVKLWWSLFILDKCLAVELQRPPLIRDSFSDQEMASSSNEPGSICFSYMVQLARIQGQVCERLLDCTWAEESGKVTLQQAILNKIRVSGQLGQVLSDWVARVPVELRQVISTASGPSKLLTVMARPSEFPSCSPEILPAVSFLILQYYQTCVCFPP
jgi:hypothetical protein